MKGFLRVLFFLFAFQSLSAQEYVTTAEPLKISFWEPAKTPNKKRIRGLNASAAVAYTGLMLGLNEYWYKDFPRSSFHFFNDNGEWNQIDKVGHVWTSYTEGLAMMEMYRWAGLENRKAILIGGAMGSVFQTSIEILDGFSEKWGASPGDLLANTLGSAILISQELIWEEQKFMLKFGPSLSSYDDYQPFIQDRVDDLYGTTFAERILKDYNSQTYWLSFHPSVFKIGRNLPPWLNISIGYGVDDIFGGFENSWNTESEIFSVEGQYPRKREYSIGLDVRFSALPAKKKYWKILFKVLDTFKLPFPSVSVNSSGDFDFNTLFLY